ncbi:MAG TPA: radical SAM protein [Xanthobacteraceae bacterium]|nr:radical SAM protein [Xanthobacteraceae bacterium]
MADIVIINPKFEISFWGFEAGLRFLGKRANLPVGALPLLAALTPTEHRVTLIDENVETLDFDRCARADIVGITGMSVQRRRMREIAAELKRRGCFVVIGGPWVSVSEDYFGGLADVIFVGEAEETWPRFLKERQAGHAARRYEQTEKTDMTRVPAPRFDLLKMNRYAFGSVQFSRGCPFQCEFCDIIVVYGRRPRIKRPAQIIAELEALRTAKASLVFVVDDNLIGNKKEMKKILRDVIAWQQAKGFPLTFATEASLDLADDDELMRLMVEANFNCVFVGIESVDENALRETKKIQNMRRSGTLTEKVRRIQDTGMEVWAGMIVGFDSDTDAVFESQRRFIAGSRISLVMVGMLSAIPGTPLHARLTREGRLDASDSPDHGTNVLPLQMNREALSRGYVLLMTDLYEPTAFFDRVDELWIGGPLITEPGWRRFAASRPWLRLRKQARSWLEAVVVTARVILQLNDNSLRKLYLGRVIGALRRRPDGVLLRLYAIRCAMHFHLHALTRQLRTQDGRLINTY